MNVYAQPTLYVPDTHILIWYLIGSRRLSDELRNTIDQARLEGGRLLIPTMVLAEAFHLAAKNRIEFDFDELYQLVQTEPEFEIVDFSIGVFREMLRIRRVPEIHDRIIAATARYYDAYLLTRDGVIRSSDEVNTL